MKHCNINRTMTDITEDDIYMILLKYIKDKEQTKYKYHSKNILYTNI